MKQLMPRLTLLGLLVTLGACGPLGTESAIAFDRAALKGCGVDCPEPVPPPDPVPAPEPPAPSPWSEGFVVRGSAPAQYLMQGGKRRLIPDAMTYDALGLLTVINSTITDAELAALPLGDPLPHQNIADGSLVRSPTTSAVYYVRSLQRQVVPLPATLQTLGLYGQRITWVTDATLSTMPITGELASRATTFSFSLDAITIHELRAHSSDTDVLYINARVDNVWLRPTVVLLGDLGKQLYTFNTLVLPGLVVIKPESDVLITYSVYNGGSVTNQVLEQAALTASPYAPPTLAGPTWTRMGDVLLPGGTQGSDPFWRTFINDYVNILGGGWLYGRLFASCDGTVAWGQLSLKGSKMLEMTQQTGTYTATLNFPGLDSPTGCGGNSNYDLTWSLKRQ